MRLTFNRPKSGNYGPYFCLGFLVGLMGQGTFKIKFDKSMGRAKICESKLSCDCVLILNNKKGPKSI